MATTRRFGVFAFGKQSALGTPLANPTYAVPKLSGAMRPVKERGDLPRLGTVLARLGMYTQRARGEGTISIMGHPDEIGLLIYEAMGAQAIAGSGPYTHTFTMSDDQPYTNPLTVWSKVGDSWWRFRDTFISRLAIMGTTGENVTLELDLVSFHYNPSAAPTLPGGGVADEEPRFKYIGSTTQLEANNAVPVTMTNIENVSLEIDRTAELRYGAQVNPSTYSPDRLVSFSAGMVYDSTQQGWDFLEQFFTGTTGGAGTGPDQGIARGSFDVLFGKHPSASTSSLRIQSNGANWEYETERPDAEASPSLLELELNGPMVYPDSGSTEVTVVLINDINAVY